jgi:SAM-dependent methyltransferase
MACDGRHPTVPEAGESLAIGRVSRDESAVADRQPIAFQRDWDPDDMRNMWPRGLDNAFILDRQAAVAIEATAAGTRGPVLEVGAAEGHNACELAKRGLPVVALEPGPGMLARAAMNRTTAGVRVTLVRGIAEQLPFGDRLFERVLCESALDHVADPRRAIAEMARVLKPDGQLVIGFVNYGSPNVRLARLVYGVARALGARWSRHHLFWDSPVPSEHTFECTYPDVASLCAPHFVPDRAIGVSIGWAFPGWGPLLDRLPQRTALAVLARLDWLARRVPRAGDYMLTMWRPR